MLNKPFFAAYAVNIDKSVRPYPALKKLNSSSYISMNQYDTICYNPSRSCKSKGYPHPKAPPAIVAGASEPHILAGVPSRVP